ncbi:MAG TPA: ABC transporter ATP-binding protein [Desulfocapsa sulfexigens]|nr:ABC transporter ATP-binding protein [Desulfocapsa sulfexigens]
MITFMNQILEWTPELKGKFILAAIYKVLEAIFMGAPYGFVFLTLNDLLTKSLSLKKITFYTIGMIICFVLQGIFSYLFNQIIWPTANLTVKKLRILAGEHLRKLSMGHFSEKNTGTLNTLVVEEMVHIQMALYQSFPDFVVAFTFMTIVPGVLLFIDWRLALVAVVAIPAAIPFYYWSSREFKRGLIKRSGLLAKVNSEIIEYVQGIEVLKAFKLTEKQFAKFDNILRQFKKANINLVLKADVPVTMTKVILDLGLGIILLTATFFLFNGTVSLTVFLIFVIMGLRMYDPIKMLIPAVGMLKLAEPGMYKLKQLLDTKPLPQPIDPPEDTLQSFDIHFKNVNFSYGNETVLENVNFHIPEKTITALVGPSGSGKTTITRLIARFWDVDSGEIQMGGRNIKDMQIDSLISKVSMVFQDVYLFNDTIYQNIAYGAKNADPETIKAAAKTAQCHEFISEMVDGYDTMVGEGGATLSGGEKQRISIARAILKDAPIILLDEATASVDPENEFQIQSAINALVASKTLIIIAHRLATITSADQIIVLNEQGRIEEIGKHESLLENNGLYARLWQGRVQAKKWHIANNGDNE